MVNNTQLKALNVFYTFGPQLHSTSEFT